MKNKAYLLPACKTADGVPIGIGSEVYAITFKQKVNKYGRLLSLIHISEPTRPY